MEKSCAFVEFLLYNHFVEFIACIVIVSLLFYCVYVLKRKNRHHDDYRESYSSPRYYEPTSDGESFEILVENKLSKLEKAGAKEIRNCYLRWKNGTTTQIDNILIFRSGLYVIECKDFSGWIFGSSTDEYWTQTLPYGWNGDSTRNSFYNPIKQNQNHINCLRQKLPDYKLIPIHSIIVFGNNCSFRRIENESYASIIKVENLYEAIWKIEQGTKSRLVQDDIDRIYSRLSEDVVVDNSIKSEHILNVQRIKNQKIKEKQSTDNTCPRCGSPLVLRDGQYGRFYGCMRYPSCKYTRRV